MARAVKTGSTYRQQQAAATKERIADAARRLFATQGFSATSMETIAAEAGVAVRTVYAAFGTKREILSFICEQWLERARARERAQEVFAEPNPRRRIFGAASWLADLYAAGFDVVEILEAASDDSPETRALMRAKLAGRNQVMNAMIASVSEHLTVPLAEAQAVYRALAAAGVYRELVVDCGWSSDRLALWYDEVLARHIFDPRV
jgi:AcrR family transcriptional regulator